MSISVSSGLVDITIQDEVYWGWGGVMMLINGGGSVDKTYTFKVKKGGATPIRTKSGTTMNQDVYVSITLKNGDGTPPTITSSTFDSLNLNMVPPHQPIEYFFSENMSNGRIPWLATKQGGQSVASTLNNLFAQVSGYYDHLGGYRFLIYNLGEGLDIDTEYEYTILGADMDPALNLFLTPAMDPTGEKMRNTYTRRFRTSKVKITDPKSSNVRVLMGGQEVDIIPTITSLPVQLGIQTASDVSMLIINDVQQPYVPNNNKLIVDPPDNFTTNFYFKSPGKHILEVPSMKFSSECPLGMCDTGKDYIQVNVQPPEKQVVANVGVLNFIAQVAYDTCNYCIYVKNGSLKHTCSYDLNLFNIHPDLSNDTPEDVCRTIWMDKYYTVDGQEAPPPLLTTICLTAKNLCNRGVAECEEEFERCNRLEHIDNCKVDRCWLPAGGVVDPNDPQWSEHFVDMCNNYSGTLETGRTERCERDAGGNFKIVYYNSTNNVIYHHKRLDWNINKAFLFIDKDYLKYNGGDRDDSSIIKVDPSKPDKINIDLRIDRLEIKDGMANFGTTICAGADETASIEGYMTNAHIYFYIKPYLEVDADGVRRIKFDIPESGGDIGVLELFKHNEICDSSARDFLEDHYLNGDDFRVTMERMFLEGNKPLLQSAIFGMFGLTGIASILNPDNSQEAAEAFKQIGYRNLDDIYFNSTELEQGWDNLLDIWYEKVNLKARYLWGLRPNY